ncbi:hypothetical protein CANARDRAFT_21764 [[Candida] arabinofermentans NRRL YB-2248]|uniref:DUF1746 domain-containing protein n=1 Tax=[Candida] arabinofermentans NRRL YB-2248 TaxID=983967 RepID=A0A1E4T4X0_9ASCO|nr:hypothetical protein CANARDRAFT_21764 [[Candida] arabinofermentans NRRL YB-2248]
MKFNDDEITKELEIHNNRTLKRRKQEFKESLNFRLDSTCYLFIMLLLLTDNSFLLFLMRLFHQFTISHPPNASNSDDGQGSSSSFKKVIANKVMGISFVFNLAFLATCFYNASNSEFGTGYWYGGLSLNLTGEKQFSSWLGKLGYLLMLQLILISLQLLEFATAFVLSQNLLEDQIEGDVTTPYDDTLKPVESIEPIKEYDGYQGDILLYRIDVLQFFKKVRSFGNSDVVASARLSLRQNVNSGSGGSAVLDGMSIPGSIQQLRRFTEASNMV